MADVKTNNEVRRENFKSDFDFFLWLKSSNGNEIGWPDFDWRARFWTNNKANVFEASCIGGVPTNCFNDGGQIHVVANDHGLGAGSVKVEWISLLPNDIYPDGTRKDVKPMPINIELVTGAGDDATEAEVAVLLPVLKGDKGDALRYGDLTEEQIAELQRPATEAAADNTRRTDELIDHLMEYDEQTRIDNEVQRVEAETLRETAETDRETAESRRRIAENYRVSAEQTRGDNESKRIEDFNALKEDMLWFYGESSKEYEKITDKIEEVNAVYEQTRGAEQSRVNAEQSRVDAERSRVEAENKRVGAEITIKNNEADRLGNETQRVKNENERIENEKKRLYGEMSREEWEAVRRRNEEERQADEQTRIDNEDARVLSEQTRISAHSKREGQAKQFAIAENERVANEQAREAAEAGRQSNEQRRVQAEADRAEEFAGFADDITAAGVKTFDDLWLSAVGIDGSVDHSHVENGMSKPYYLNELWLTYEEARDVMIMGNRINAPNAYTNYNNISIRTNLPPIDIGNDSLKGFIFNGQPIEVINLRRHKTFTTKTVLGKAYAMVGNCRFVRKIIGVIDISTADSLRVNAPILNCPELTELSLSKLKNGFYLGECPSISYNSIHYMIVNASNSQRADVILHPDVYSKITDSDNPDYAEWHPLLALAESKNISLATV